MVDNICRHETRSARAQAFSQSCSGSPRDSSACDRLLLTAAGSSWVWAFGSRGATATGDRLARRLHSPMPSQRRIVPPSTYPTSTASIDPGRPPGWSWATMRFESSRTPVDVVGSACVSSGSLLQLWTRHASPTSVRRRHELAMPRCSSPVRPVKRRTCGPASAGQSTNTNAGPPTPIYRPPALIARWRRRRGMRKRHRYRV